jgi:2-(1,2-epoxy-1,2-dihydrophenyl)acetyl-CoA isomerase
MSEVTVSTDGAVLTIALTAASGINGLTSAVRCELLEAFIGPALEQQVRAVVLRGVGRTFCVGQDLTELAARLDADPSTALEIVASEYNPLVRAIRAVPVPVVAGINGPAAGAGIGLALACDVVLLSDAARLTFAFAGVGLAADSGLHATLAEAVGARRARALLMLNAPLDAPAALAAGLADALVPAGQFDQHLTQTAARLAAGPTAAFGAMKTIIAAGGDLEDVLDAEAHAQMALGEGHDHGAAVRAFLAKATPSFLGR